MMTFQEFREKNDPYVDCVGYSYDVEKNQWVPTEVSEDTKMLIADWFDTRELCDEPAKFARFFRRKLNITALRYAQLRRVELSAFDPLVANYTERETINNSTKIASNSREGSSNVSKDNELTRNNNITVTDKRDGTNSDTSEGSRNGSTGNITDRNGSTSEDDKNINKQAPQSIVNGNVVAGKIPDMDWTYATAMAQAGKEGSSTEHENSDGTSAEHSNDSRNGTSHSEGSNTTVGSGTDKSKGNEVGSTSESGSSNETGNDINHEISSGRGGLTPQEAFRTAADYIKGCSAFEWFKRELEEVFLLTYDI